MCTDQMTVHDAAEESTTSGIFITFHALFESAFNAQIDAISDKFLAKMDSKVTTNTAAKLVMLIIEQSQIHSALQTNAFEFAVPGWDWYYPVVMTSYPLHNHGSVDNVSSRIRYVKYHRVQALVPSNSFLPET